MGIYLLLLEENYYIYNSKSYNISWNSFESLRFFKSGSVLASFNRFVSRFKVLKDKSYFEISFRTVAKIKLLAFINLRFLSYCLPSKTNLSP